MKKVLVFIALSSMWGMVAHAQTAANDDKTFVGINAGHTIIAARVNSALTEGSLFVPIHINAFKPLSKNFALSGLLMYRGVRSPSHTRATSTFGIAVGPSYTSKYLNGFFVDCKIGFAFTAGRDNDSDHYTRSDFLIQPEVGYFFNLSHKFTMSIGFGIQSLLRIRENPRMEDVGYEWDNLGKMGQYYLPVANVTFGVKL